MPKKSRRGWGEGSVERGRFAEGEYRVQVSLGRKPDGKRDRRYVYGATKEEALAAAFRLKQGRKAKRPPTEGETLGVFLTRWLDRRRRRVRDRTYAGYEQCVRLHIMPALGRRPVREVTPGEVDDLLQSIVERGLSARTANKVRTTLVSAFKDGIVLDGLTSNPAQAVSGRTHRYARFSVLTPDQTTALIAEAGDLAPYIVLAVGTGLRQGELLGLTWDDISGDVLHVRRVLNPKGGYHMEHPKTEHSERTIPLTKAVREALRQQRDRQRIEAGKEGYLATIDWPDGEEYDLVFRRPNGAPVDGTGLTKQWRRLIDRVNDQTRALWKDTGRDPDAAPQIPQVRWHDLRHTFATMLIEQAVPLEIVSELLGHTNLNTTAKIYGHPGEDIKRRAIDTLDTLLA